MTARGDAALAAPAPRGVLARAVGRPVFWVLVVAASFAWPILASLRVSLPPPLPVLGQVPPFELVDQGGRPFGSRDLENRVWLAGFIFTRCSAACPGITAQMARIQGRTRELAPVFHLVSFSVDPARDTPSELAAYARSHHANPLAWSFLTGPEGAIRQTVVDGLKTAMGRDPGEPEGIFHGNHLALVDRRGRVRGYYDPADRDAVDRAVRDAALLVNRGD